MPTPRRTSFAHAASLRHIVPVLSLVAAVLGVTLLGPRIVSGFSDKLRHETAPVPVPTSLVPTTLPISAAPPTGPVGGATSATTTPTSVATAIIGDATDTGAGTVVAPIVPVPAASQTTDIPTTPAATAAPPAAVEVSSIQVVPAVRDVIVQINGTMMASNDLGMIEVPPASRHGSITYIGIRSTPALRQVDFIGWDDGSQAATRPLDRLEGPTAQIGLVVRSRVMVTTTAPEPVAGDIQFTSEAGPLQLTIGQPTWVMSDRAIAGGEGFTPQSLTYSTQSLLSAGVALPVAVQSFTAAPEAQWMVTV